MSDIVIEPDQIAEPPNWLQAWNPIPRDFRVKFLDAKGNLHWQSNPGPQTWSLFCPYEEIVIGGRRGGGKSGCLIARPAMGDSSLPKDDPARYSFLNDRSYKALLLREEYQSMLEFVEEAIEFYKPFGGKPTGDPKRIEFKSGARIYFNHLQDESAYTKYKGWNITFIGIEELTQIALQKSYVKLLGSLRSVERVRNGKTYPPLRTQIFSTTNPDGPGASWILDRFIEVRSKGQIIKPNTPMLDPITGSTRIFIPFPIEANPFLSEKTTAGKRYRAMLMSQDEITRKQWMEGDWHASSSQFFTEYRANGPVSDEEKTKFPWARHIIKPVPLKPWWYRWGGGDIGYSHPSAYHKFVRNEADGRVHVYDELQVRQVGSFEQGAMLAKWWHDELLGLKMSGQQPCITIHMGKDVFDKTDYSKTRAEEMAAGIREVLGPYGALLLKYTDDERDMMLRDKQRAQQMFDRRRAEIGDSLCIALKPVYFNRVSAWAYVRDQLRWRPAILQFHTDTEREDYLRDVLKSEGREAYERTAMELQKIKPEILPKVLIWDRCVQLDRCLKAAQRDMRNEGDSSGASKIEDVRKFNADPDTGLNGDDALEAFRDGLLAFKDIQTTIPLSYYVADRVNQAQEQHIKDFGEELTDPTRLAMISQTQAANYTKQHGVGLRAFTPARASSLRHRNTRVN